MKTNEPAVRVDDSNLQIKRTPISITVTGKMLLSFTQTM